MGRGNAETSEADGGAGQAPPPQVFISYRHSDTAGEAGRLYDRLALRFGAGNVFYDAATLHDRSGAKWFDEIKRHGSDACVLVALIGPRWVETMRERSHRRRLDPEEDYVRRELEAALRAGVPVLPVLVGGAEMPDRSALPAPLHPLADRQGPPLRHVSWEDDVAHLVAEIERVGAERAEQIAAERAEQEQAGREAAAKGGEPVAGPEPEGEPAAPPPDRRHLEDVTSKLVNGVGIVLFLGSGANASDQAEAWEEGCGRLPDAQELARALSAYLPATLKDALEPTDLAQASQYLAVTEGSGEVHQRLKAILTADCAPTSVHRFFARLPARLRTLGLRERHVLIVTTNYDDALERAFEEAEESFDLVVYMATGPHRGKFLHLPWGGEQQPVTTANLYVDLPIGDDLELERTIIVKVHGAVESTSRRVPWRENYVVTENDYIGYLSQSPIEDLVPTQILDKLRDSHYLFLGYTMRDWNLRVFLQRLWGEQKLGEKRRSWAVEADPDLLERDFWERVFGVDLFASPLARYVSLLDEQLAALAASLPEPSA